MRWWLSVVRLGWPWVVLCALVARGARAEHALHATTFAANAVRIDGDLRDWRGLRFIAIGDDRDGSLEYALGADEQALYVGARVFDDELVRSATPSPREDALALTVWLPGDGGQAVDVWLYAGIPGKQPSSAALGPSGGAASTSKRVTIVEGPLTGHPGYVLEARVPWEALPQGANHALARAALRLQDVDGKPGNKPVLLASARTARPVQLPALLIDGGPNAAVQDFLAAKQLASNSVRFDLIGQVAGDARLDRVVVAGTFVVVAGPDLATDAGYQFMDLPVTSAADVLAAQLRDLTGDGNAELVLRLEQRDELGTRELLDVLALGPGQPRVLFAAALRRQTEQGKVEDAFALQAGTRGKPGGVELRIGSAQGLDSSRYNERPPAGIEPILTPWGPLARRTFRWDGTRFAVSAEEPNRDALAASATSSAPNTAVSSGRAREPANEHTVVHAKPPGMDDLVAAFREARGVEPQLRPRFLQHANVAEDGQIESLMLFDKDLLVIGKGYRAGTGFFYFSLPVQAGSDVQRVFTADVTGDGRRELFVRNKQQIGDVQRELLTAYRFDEQGMTPILRVEVRRAQDENSVGNVVDLVRDGTHWALRIAPGLAQGWSAQSYPFVSESSDDVAPLLLPWKDRSVRYRFDGSALVAR